jgi:hypothetical protein
MEVVFELFLVVLGLGHMVIQALSSANNLEPLTHVSGVFRKFPGGFRGGD